MRSSLAPQPSVTRARIASSELPDQYHLGGFGSKAAAAAVIVSGSQAAAAAVIVSLSQDAR